jgi:hypothetical protein
MRRAAVSRECESVACKMGRLAQLGEHQLDKLGVTGSSPVPPIDNPSKRPHPFSPWMTLSSRC